MPVLKFSNIKLTALKDTRLKFSTKAEISSKIGQDISSLKLNVFEKEGAAGTNGIVIEIPNKEKQLKNIQDDVISLHIWIGERELGFYVEIEIKSNKVIAIRKLDNPTGGSWIYDMGMKVGDTIYCMEQNWNYGVNMYWDKLEEENTIKKSF